MLKKGKKKIVFQEKGFSLFEVLVAVFIILLALAGAMALLSMALRAASTSSSRLVAANLAQEGIEIVKNMRDLSYLDSGTWDDWYNSFTGWSRYIVQYNDEDLRPFINTPLKFNAATGLYSYDSGNDTIYNFRRTITMNKTVDNENRILVTATVTWTEKGVAKSLSVEDRIWNWR